MSMSASIPTTGALDGLPPEWPEYLLPFIQAQVRSSRRKIVVLDDDPTGTQTVHGVPVLTTWTVEAIAGELRDRAEALYIMTNSRSLTAAAADELGRDIGANLARAAQQTGVELEVISRSDSTLRGHFPGEVNALKLGLGAPSLPCLLIPFFLEGGRYTIGDVHYVAEDKQLVPAARTPYARDAVFGYRRSNLRRWIEEKTKGRAPAEHVTTITLEDLRRGGPESVADKLAAMAPKSYGIVNAAAYRDLEVLVTGLLRAEAADQSFIFRTAASFVRVRAGIAPRGLLRGDELTAATSHGGLFVVGSYVPKTTTQLTVLLKNNVTAAVEIAVHSLLVEALREKEIRRAVEAVNRHIRQGEDTVVFTSRKLVTGTNDEDNLAIGHQVSDSLIRIVHGLDCQPRYLVAKGGITSSDVATRGLGVQRAMVMGQVMAGVPVWRLGEEARYPGMAYIVFPGNVGEDNALAIIQERLARRT
jgi:uncharacterized protein YgbK (DUF1537 family)